MSQGDRLRSFRASRTAGDDRVTQAWTNRRWHKSTNALKLLGVQLRKRRGANSRAARDHGVSNSVLQDWIEL